MSFQFITKQEQDKINDFLDRFESTEDADEVLFVLEQNDIISILERLLDDGR